MSNRRSPRSRARKSTRSVRAVEIPLEVEQVRLDQHRAAGAEGRPHADADRRAAVGGPRRRRRGPGTRGLVGDDVGGRKAERAAALVAGDDLAAQAERRAEQARGGLDLAGQTSARIRLEETISPSTSTSGTTRVSNRESACSIATSPAASWPKRKFSPTDT